MICHIVLNIEILLACYIVYPDILSSGEYDILCHCCQRHWVTNNLWMCQLAVANLQTSQLMDWKVTDWTVHGPVNSWTGQLADDTANRKQHYVVLIHFFQHYQHHRFRAHKPEEQNVHHKRLSICKISTET